MAKHLWIMRHAKSAWPDSIVEDLNRPLSKQGKEDAKAVGKWLAAQDHKPQIISVSPAKRARATVKRVRKQLGDCPVSIAEELYGHSVLGYMQVVQEIADDAECALVVGHNPDLEQLIIMLTGNVVAMTTSCIAHIDFQVSDWRDIREGTGELVQITNRHQAAASTVAADML